MTDEGSASFEAAVVALGQCRFRDALAAIQVAAAVASETNNATALASCLSVQIEASLGLEQIQLAADTANRLEELLRRETISSVFKIPILASLANASRLMHDADTTIARFKRAIAAYDATNAVEECLLPMKAQLLDQLGYIALSTGNLEVASDAGAQLVTIYSRLRNPQLESDALMKCGQVAEAQHDGGKALQLFDKAIAVARAANHGPSLVAALACKAHSQVNQGEFRDSLDTFRDLFKARDHYDYHEHEEQNVVMMSHAFALTGQPAEAMSRLKDLSLDPAHPAHSMATLDRAGASLELDDPAEAVRLLEGCAASFENDPHGDADRLRILGLAHERLGNIAPAARCYWLSVGRARQAGDTSLAGFALSKLGQKNLASFLSEDQKSAITTQAEGLLDVMPAGARADVHDPAAGSRHDILSSFFLLKKASALRFSGAFNDAIAHYTSALEELRASDEYGPDTVMIAQIHLELGITYRMMGRYDEAKSAYETAMTLSIALMSAGPIEINARINLAKLHLRRQQIREAEDVYAPVKNAKKSGPLRLMELEYHCELQAARGLELAKLAQQVEQVVVLATELGFVDRKAMWQAILGDLLGQVPARREDALACYRAALEFFQEHMSYETSTAILTNRARLYAQMGRYEAAYDDMTAALKRVEHVMSSMDSLWLERREMERVVDWCSEMIAVCCKLDRAERGFEVAELMRSRILKKLLGSNADAATLNEEHLNESWNRLSKLRHDLELRFATQRGPSAAEFGQYKAVTTELHKLADRIRSCGGETTTRQQWLDFRFMEPREVIANDEATAVLELTIDDTGTYALIDSTDRGVPQLKYLSALTLRCVAERLGQDWYRSSELDGRQSALGSTLLETRDTSMAGRTGFSEGLDRLLRFTYDMLLAAPASDGTSILEDLVSLGTRRLVVVAHRLLHLLPIHAAYTLRGEKRHHLCHDFEVGYAPSLAVLQRCRTRPALQGHSLTAVVDGSLPHARDEGRVLRQYFRSSSLVEHSHATLDELGLHLRTSDICHFACHGHADLSRPLESGLGLSNGVLTLEKMLRSMSVRPGSLVVLSACETSVGQVSSTDEYLGLAAGFLVAGARCVVSSLWPVDDFATCVLFCRFYQNLIESRISVGASLRDAQEFLRTSSRAAIVEFCEENRISLGHMAGGYERPFSDPVFWAAFQAVGTFWDGVPQP